MAVEKYPLHPILTPLNYEERLHILENWNRITSYFNSIQSQIKFLAGGEDIDELIKRIDDTILKAQNDIEVAINANNVATQDAISANNTATQDLINTTNLSVQAVLGTITTALNQLNEAVQNAVTATDEAITAKNETIQTTNLAIDAIADMQLLIQHFGSAGVHNLATSYYKNNLVSDDNGNTYIAKTDNTGVPLTDTTAWELFVEKGERGERGEKGDTGAALSIQGKLTDVSQLPASGSAGQAYTVNGELYVWSENTNEWENVGNIKGEKGDIGLSAYQVALVEGFVGTEAEWLATLKGDKGEKGETGNPGADADLTEITQTVTQLGTKVTEHLNEIASTTELGHIMPDGTTIVVDPLTGVASSVGGIASHAIDYKAHTPYVSVTHNSPTTGAATLSAQLEGVTELYEGLSLSFKIPVKTADTQGYFLNVNNLGSAYIITPAQGLLVGVTITSLTAHIITVRYSGGFWVIQGTPRISFRFNNVTPWTGWTDGSNLDVGKDYEKNIIHVRASLQKSAQSTQIIAQLPEGFRPRTGQKIVFNILAPTGATYSKISGGFLTDDGVMLFLNSADVTAITTGNYVFMDFSFTIGF